MILVPAVAAESSNGVMAKKKVRIRRTKSSHYTIGLKLKEMQIINDSSYEICFAILNITKILLKNIKMVYSEPIFRRFRAF